MLIGGGGEGANTPPALGSGLWVECYPYAGVVAAFEAVVAWPADVEDEIDVGVEEARRLEVGHRLDEARVDRKGIFHKVLAVACGGAAADRHPVPAAGEDLDELLPDDLDGVAPVRAVVVVEDAPVLRHQHELGRRAAAVDAEVGVPLVGVEVGAADRRLPVAV